MGTFRSETLDQAISIYKEIFSFSIFSTPTLGDSRLRLLALFYVLLMFSIEWISRTSTNPLEFITQDIKRRIRWPIYIFFQSQYYYFLEKILVLYTSNFSMKKFITHSIYISFICTFVFCTSIANKWIY